MRSASWHRKRVKTCVHALHVIVARKLPGQDVEATSRRPSLVFQSKIAAPAD
jgi:hypothetical protein